MTTCQIIFENNSMKVVYTGQSIRGTVVLNLAEEVNVRGLYIHLYGGAYAHWRERLKCKVHTGNEDYLNQRIYLEGATNGHVRLSPRVYKYNFECKLQNNLPTSFEGKHGYVRYTALVVLDHQYLKEKTFSESFTVIREVNLNYNLQFRNRIIVEKRGMYKRSYIMFCWCPDPLKIITRTPVGAYTPGQMINLDLIVENQTGLRINKFIALLIRQVTYSASGNSNDQLIERITINKQIVDGCVSYKNTIILINVEVPSTPPTDLTTSNIIKIEYTIQITGVMPGCRSNIRIEPIPITIGTYPIYDNMLISITDPHIIRYSSYPNDEPPIYEDAFEVKGVPKTSYKPKYAIFNHNTAYSSRS